MSTTLATPTLDSTDLISKAKRPRALFDAQIAKRAIGDSFMKLNPMTLAKNPVMFVVEIGATLTTLILFRDAVTKSVFLGFDLQICLWLWFTVLFANFAEAMAEGRGKAQADNLRKTKTEALARKVIAGGREEQ